MPILQKQSDCIDISMQLPTNLALVVQPIHLLICLLLVAGYPHLARAEQQMSIGVLAFRGEAGAIQRWSSTAQYLSDVVDGYSFQIIPLTLDSMANHVKQDKLDFILTNTGNYVVLEYAFGVSRLATLKLRHLGNDFTQFGGVIFTRHDHPDLRQLKDLTGHTMMAVSEHAFGGFQMAWRELIDLGIDPFKDLAGVRFNGFPQDEIVRAVIAGRVDAGTVRSGTIERMAADGLIDIGNIKLLGPRYSADFPFLHSTRLYPEWPFAKARHTSEKLAQRVAIALLQLKPEHPAAQNAFAAGWTIPLDYGPVHELFRELEIGPYAFFGKPSLKSIWREYQGWILFSLVMLLLLFGLLITIGRANRRISMSQTRYREEAVQRKQAQEMLEIHKQELELRVEERTIELADVNTSLRRSEATLRAMHDITTNPDRGFLQKLDSLLDEGCNFFEMEFAAITRVEADADDDIMRRHSKTAIDDIDIIELCRCMQLEITCRQQPVAILDLERHRLQNQLTPGSFGGAVLAADYQVDDEFAGIILFGLRKPGHRQFSDVDINILQLMAQWLGGEIELSNSNRRAQEHQSQLAHVARLNTMGEMAAVIAHELNQPLTAINNYSNGSLRLLKKYGDVPAELRRAIEKTGKDARRAAGIIKHLREFLKRGAHQHEQFKLRDCIEPAVELLRPRLQQNNIEVSINFADAGAGIAADRIQIEQVVVNLLLNAIDAVQDKKQLERRVQIDIVAHEPESISVAVSNSGAGLAEDLVARLFEPFFTTKQTGMGMG
ncbi:MAG: PhnD/SsuA/transferrin family substrate-binding protein [Gammaproteobacteria bacterium]|nr:PhnD/SsuA/transferrin family substrate-binding protein [Gammaproteobacteria bacterium]